MICGELISRDGKLTARNGRLIAGNGILVARSGKPSDRRRRLVACERIWATRTGKLNARLPILRRSALLGPLAIDGRVDSLLSAQAARWPENCDDR